MEAFHHGIYLGAEENFKVIDFGQNGVRQMDLMEFHAGQPLFRVSYPEPQCIDPCDVILEALAFFYGEFGWGEYDLFKNNCEHFATWCKTKIKMSPQASQELQQSLFSKCKQVVQVMAASSAQSFQRS